ncbi:MAG: multiubiquitin domain-containing protein [Alphaproteobacteria bacterium]|nr:multiubiquitin domain-containing protein [Alphaproteobacteria bacterium]
MSDPNHTSSHRGGNYGERIEGAAASYKYRVDKIGLTSPARILTGRDVLIAAGKNPPERYQLLIKKGAELEPIGLDHPVDLASPGIERFVSLALDQTEGETLGAEHSALLQTAAPRRQVPMLPEDEAYLDSLGLRWETVREGRIARVVIYDYPVPPGYDRAVVDVNVRIEPAYPDVQIDMVYVHPALARCDGRTISGLADDQFDGKRWQRWSRHRTSQNPWRPGVDDLSSHMALVNHWFSREVAV